MFLDGDDLRHSLRSDLPGGGVYVGGGAVTISASRITYNRARGGEGDDEGADGQGVGGGLYVTPGGVVCADLLTAIFANDASTSANEVFGTLGSC